MCYLYNYAVLGMCTFIIFMYRCNTVCFLTNCASYHFVCVSVVNIRLLLLLSWLIFYVIEQMVRKVNVLFNVLCKGLCIKMNVPIDLCASLCYIS